MGCCLVKLLFIVVLAIICGLPPNAFIFTIVLIAVIDLLWVCFGNTSDNKNKEKKTEPKPLPTPQPTPPTNDITPEDITPEDITPEDITPEDIINDNIEFTDDAIYYKKKKWDGVRYTIERQKVYAYKRSYHLGMGEPPRFHICRCSTMDLYIKSKTLEIKYRKSDKPSVWAKDMDNYDEENLVSHLPLCLNCYKKMKAQHSYIDSKMDNVDFVNRVIKRIRNAPPT